jgi:hypothetical protein
VQVLLPPLPKHELQPLPSWQGGIMGSALGVIVPAPHARASGQTPAPVDATVLVAVVVFIVDVVVMSGPVLPAPVPDPPPPCRSASQSLVHAAVARQSAIDNDNCVIS